METYYYAEEQTSYTYETEPSPASSRAALPVSPTRRNMSSPTADSRRPSPTRQSRPASPTRDLSYAFKSNGKNDDRSSYIRLSKHTSDLYYDLPGMADLVKKQNVKGPRFDAMSGDRSSYLKRSHQVTGLVYDLPGMASRPASRTTDFSKGSERRGKDMMRFSSPVKPAAPTTPRQMNDVVYDLPGMAEAIRKSDKGSSSFRMTSPRMMYVPQPSPAHNVTQRSEAGTIAHEVQSNSRQSPLRKGSDAASASFRMTSSRFDSPTKASSQRFAVDAYDLPGMAADAVKSPRGTASFRNSTARDSYIKAFPKQSDLIYDIPGISGVVYGPTVLSTVSSSASLRGGGGSSPTRRKTAAEGGGSNDSLSSPLGGGVQGQQRFLSPTASFVAKQQQQQQQQQLY